MSNVEAVASTEELNQQTAHTVSMGKEDFLKLLIAQLENQDPLDPMDDTEFLSQLAQLSSLEQLQNINANLSNSQEATTLLSRSINSILAPSLIGREIKAWGNAVQLSEGSKMELHYELAGDAQVRVDIYDSNARLVRSLEVGYQGAGAQKVEWNGKDEQGHRLPSGWYTYAVVATDRAGSSVSASPFITGKVEGVRYEDQQVLLMLGDGRKINMSEVFQVLGLHDTRNFFPL